MLNIQNQNYILLLIIFKIYIYILLNKSEGIKILKIVVFLS